ncbi:hypothetical protein R3W88_000267 [Solanum pinnatisectum]|uniref:Uncharacterized protein n=1 Tax=Solanum pinnatisectum TaxID=50273 RepID=A0AAV9MEU8_9SOLN|nr:hypothetical protein R3W88_000267 [Solanum pinnatisectum]
MPCCEAHFLSEGISDHCPITPSKTKRNKAFKYCNIWSKHQHIVKKMWDTPVDGSIRCTKW